MDMVMVMVLNSAYTGPLPRYLPSVAPRRRGPCFARARPCLDVWWGEPSLVQRPLCWPRARTSGSSTHGTWKVKVPAAARRTRYPGHKLKHKE